MSKRMITGVVTQIEVNRHKDNPIRPIQVLIIRATRPDGIGNTDFRLTVEEARLLHDALGDELKAIDLEAE